MATISTANFKNGLGIQVDGKIYTIIEFQHVKPGKGAAFVRTKLRDLRSGRVNDMTFRAGEKVEEVPTSGQLLHTTHDRTRDDARYDRFSPAQRVLIESRTAYLRIREHEDRILVLGVDERTGEVTHRVRDHERAGRSFSPTHQCACELGSVLEGDPVGSYGSDTTHLSTTLPSTRDA